MVKSHLLFNALVGCIKILTGSFLLSLRSESILIENLYGDYRKYEREVNDFYATDPIAMHKLLKYETFNNNVWECACGEGNLSKVLKEYNYNVYSTDLIDRGYQDELINFLDSDIKFKGDIITNPPFKYASEFILKALNSVDYGNKVAMFMKLSYVTGKKRYKEIYSKFPPLKIYCFTGRVACSKNNDPKLFKSGAFDYAWFIWEKGVIGPTHLKWIE